MQYRGTKKPCESIFRKRQLFHYVGEHRKSSTLLVLPPGHLLPPKKQGWGGGKGVTTLMKISKYRVGSKILMYK